MNAIEWKLIKRAVVFVDKFNLRLLYKKCWSDINDKDILLLAKMGHGTYTRFTSARMIKWGNTVDWAITINIQEILSEHPFP